MLFKSILLFHVIPEKQLSKVKKELLDCESERKSLVEDLYEVRQAKKTSDGLLREQKERLDVLGREVVFYREQATRAISERDEMTWELESLRKEMSQMKEDISRKESLLTSLEVERDVLSQRVEEAEGRIVELEKAATEAELVPVLRQDVARLQELSNELEHAVTKLTCERNSLKESLEDQTSAAEESRLNIENSHSAEITQLKGQLEDLKGEFEETKAEKVKALIRLSDAESASSKFETESKRLQKEMVSLKKSLEIATQEKVKALIDRAAVEAQMSGSEASSVHASPYASPIKKR